MKSSFNYDWYIIRNFVIRNPKKQEDVFAYLETSIYLLASKYIEYLNILEEKEDLIDVNNQVLFQSREEIMKFLIKEVGYYEGWNSISMIYRILSKSRIICLNNIKAMENNIK